MPIQGEGMARIRLARAEEEASKNEHRLHARISELERKNALLTAESKHSFERGVQQATAVFTEIIREYVAENENLRELVRDFDKCLDTALYLAGNAGYPTMPDKKLFASLRPRMHKLGIEAAK